MRILVVTTSFPVSSDGSEAAGSFVRDFVTMLSLRNEVAVVYPVVGHGCCTTAGQAVMHFPFRVSRLPLSLLSPLNPLHWRTIVGTLKAGGSIVDHAVDCFAPDHVLALWALPSGYWAKLVKQKRGVPYSVWALGSDIWTLGKIPLIRNWLRDVLCGASCRFADGYQLLNDMEAISGCRGEFLPSLRILPASSVAEKRDSPPYRLSFLGRWHKNKGVDLLLEALELLKDSDWERIHSVTIAGGGPLSDFVNSAVAALSGKGRPVELRGFLDVNQAATLLSATDYLLVPSRIESIPVVFSDALQSRTPLVVTPVGDFSSIFKEFPPGIAAKRVAPESFAQAITKALLSTPRNYQAAIRHHLMLFDMEKVVARLSAKLGKFGVNVSAQSLSWKGGSRQCEGRPYRRRS